MMEEEMICDFRMLRELRKSHALSIVELSEQSGVSASVISKLERNQTKAELDTLYRLARVFRLSLADLISLAENQAPHQVNEEQYRSGDFTFHRVSYGNMRCMHGFARKSTTLSKPQLHSDDFETCWLRRGRLRIILPNETCLLEPGMSVQFDALLPHTYEVLEDCEVFIVHLKKGNRF
jgi:transcriptional regulator, XRE family